LAREAAVRFRADGIIFVLLLVTYAFFFQGGGWNQNSRFDQVRSIVEQGRLSINDQMLYQRAADSEAELSLRRLSNTPGVEIDRIRHLANTEDVVWVPAGGRYYPNKPPGMAFLAVPGYLMVYQLERMLGVNPDAWSTLTLNHYLTTLLSVGLLGAWGGVLMLRASRRLMPELPEWAHVSSAMTFGLATLMLPYATALYDHVAAAVLLLGSFYCLVAAGLRELTRRRRSVYLLAAGAQAGMSVIVNYVCITVVLMLTVYALWVFGASRRWVTFLAGGLPFALLLAAYHRVAFGSAFATANMLTWQSGRIEGLALGGFGLPRAEVAWKLLFGSHRGLFFTSPVCLIALGALIVSLKASRSRAPALLASCVFVFYWLFNASFEHWHSGFAVGPRYMIPALPFLCLWLAAAYAGLTRTTAVVALISAALLLLVTAVDAQAPPVYGNPLLDYVWPLFRDGSCMIQEIPIQGPVSANPIGTWEGWYYRLYPPGSEPASWSSFNLGELVWPRNRLSLLPLLVFIAAAVWAAVRRARS
jgi:hypothetical protein